MAGLNGDVRLAVCCWHAGKAASRHSVPRLVKVAAEASTAGGVPFIVDDVCRAEWLLSGALDAELYTGFDDFLSKRGLRKYAFQIPLLVGVA